ncbi:DIP1984 family protein [Nodosilinea sp. LEGE 07088]|uniref:DIP1984 family protein n=1 Tax=Nodosilinea sp. LEGE 07088 TaxID=2777968 RepID=UPI00188146D7|nr:DIP1984 family protein [Nodosilinea sp. LEGE 07088]MBE9137680.1 DIP1984 family protein [Nodosilinea sp. LEGE 07088]
MKLAEALILRADAQKHVAQLRQRLTRSARVQEGEQPPEDPQELLAELEATTRELVRLIQQINHTNSITPFQEAMLSDALATRDVLRLKRGSYEGLINAATISQDRYMRSELRFVSTVNVAELQQTIDQLSRDYRELDAQIQALNWATDLIES